MQRVTIYAMQGNTRIVTGGVSSTTLAEGSFPGCTVSVFTTGTTNLATIFGDNLNPPTPKSNPFTADSTGSGFFYAANGTRVDIQLSGTGIVTPFVLAGDVLLDDFSLTTISPPSTVAFSATPQFDLSLADWFKITLTGNVTAPTFPNANSGAVLILSIIQNAAGGNTWTWPGNFINPPAIALGSNVRTEATFKYDGTNWTMLAATGDQLQANGGTLSGTYGGNPTLSGNVVVGGTLGAPKLDGAVYCDGTTNSTFNLAVAAAGTTGTVIVTNGSVCPVSGNITVGSGVTTIFQTGTPVAIPTATTVTFNGPLVAPPVNIFSFTGTAALVVNSPTRELYPEWWGAKGDNATDDTTAINNALANANSVDGQRVLLSAGKTYVSASTISLLQFTSVRMGGSGGVGTFNSTSPVLKFTGNPAAGRLIDARSSQAIELDHMIVQYTNTSFAGRVIDLQHSIASDSQNFYIHDLTVTGTSTAKLAICGVCADNTDMGVVERSSFFWLFHAVEALNANIFTLRNSNFASANVGVGDIGGDYITDLGNSSTIGPGNNFEMSTNNRAINCATCGDGINIIGNTFNDFVAGYNAQMIVVNSNAFNVVGNFVATGPGAGTFVGSGAAVRGSFTGNTLGNWNTFWNFPNATSAVSLEISGNKYGTSAAFISLATPFLGNGRIVDDKGFVKNYGFQSSDGNAAYLTADWTCGTAGTVASCVAATIIGSGGGVPLTFTLPVTSLWPTNQSWTWECDLVVSQATAATLNQWNILTSGAGAVNVTAYYDMYTAAGTKAAGAVTDQAATTTTFQITPSWTLGGTGTKMPVRIWGRVEGAAASGTTLSLQLVAPAVGDLVTIFRGSGCRVR